MTLKIITFFSGVGMQEQGIKDLGIDYKLINYCEYDTGISKAFDIIHNTTQDDNLGDIRKINPKEYYNKLKKEGNDDIDVIISSFPCQSFSIAGKKEGFDDKKNGNLYDCQFNIIKNIKPSVVIYENVKNIQNKKFGAVKKIEDSMKSIGYICYHKVLNAIDYGIPQNRERWFMVCIRDPEISFEFPTPFILSKSVEDYVDKTHKDRMVSKDLVKYFNPKYFKQFKSNIGMKKMFDGTQQGYFESGFTTHRIYSINGVSPTFTTSNDCHFYELNGKLTSKERWLLMGMHLNDYNKLKKHISDSLIHKICGNGIVVDVFRELFKNINL